MDKHKDKLDVVLAEYKVLRDELVDLSRLHVQIYALYLSALAVFYGSMFTHKIYDIILIIPILSLALLFRLIWDQLIITKISHYIKYEIEDQKIPMLVDKIDNSKEGEEWRHTNLWLGWQHSYWKSPPPPFYEYSVIMLFLVFSIIPPVVYSIYNIRSQLLGMEVVTKLPMEIHGFLLIINLLLGYYVYKIIRENIILRRRDWKP